MYQTLITAGHAKADIHAMSFEQVQAFTAAIAQDKAESVGLQTAAHEQSASMAAVGRAVDGGKVY